MAPRTSLELIDITERRQTSYAVGTAVEIDYEMPNLMRKISYLGVVAVRPEDKASQTVVTNKYGEERILTMAATYTLKTISQTIHQYAETDEGTELIESFANPHIADLIFDPTHPAFTIKPVPEFVPQPRI